MEIKINKTDTPKQKPAPEELGFGNHFTDHMFVMNYRNGNWQDHRIIPYGDIPMSPASMVLHYALTTFEGLKAYRTKQ